MKKVIVKCKIKNLKEFEKRLEEVDMDFGPMYWLYDRVFIPRNYRERSSYPRMTLRGEMRAVDKPVKHSLVLRRHIEDNHIDIVHQTGITNYEETAAMLEQMGFVKQLEVSRRRQELVIGKNTRLFLDKIDGLMGYYAKLETVAENEENPEELRAELIETLRMLGQSEKTITNNSYLELFS